MISKLKKIFKKKELKPLKPLIIHICPLCKEDIKIKHLKKKKCCGRVYCKHCYKKFKSLFRM